MHKHFPLERVCAFCTHYGYRSRPREEGKGWAYCERWGKWFPNQLEAGHTPAGSRVCDEWVQRGAEGEKNEN